MTIELIKQLLRCLLSGKAGTGDAACPAGGRGILHIQCLDVIQKLQTRGIWPEDL